MPATYPLGANVVVPNHEASGRLVIEYSRSVKEFALNRYVTLVPCDNRRGYYQKVTAEQAARLLDASNQADLLWADGADAPPGDTGESFVWAEFVTKRYAPTEKVGDIAGQEASWDLKKQAQNICAHRAMTARTARVAGILGTSGNYDSGHTQTATQWGGGTFTAATTANPYIRKTLGAILLVIKKATLGKVKMGDMQMVFGPDVATDVGESQEFIDYLKGAAGEAYKQIKGDLPNYNQDFNLPEVLYNCGIVVEDAVKVTSAKLATRSADFVWPAATAAVVARPGQLVSELGPGFSSMSIFARKGSELAVEEIYDEKNKYSLCRVIDETDEEFTATASAALVTSATT